jgi:hypothetical protein
MSEESRMFHLKKFHRNISDEELLEDVRRVSSEIGGGQPKLLEYRARGKFHDNTLCSRFGSWDAVLKRAGFSGAEHNMHISDDELFRNIENVWIALGRQPTRRDMIRPRSKYSESPYRNRFGGWQGALVKFIDWVNNNDAIPIDSSQSKSVSAARENRDPNLRQRFRVMQRDRFRCVMCGNSPAKDPSCILHIDHIVPWSLEGKTTIDNLQTLCQRCNLGKGNLMESS